MHKTVKMLNEQQIQEVIDDQALRLKALKSNDTVLRSTNYTYLVQTPFISVITGVRRSGKSTLLQQLTAHFEHFYYINFDDERLFNFQLDDFQKLMLLFAKRGRAKVVFLDEIQNISNWERFVRRIYDEGYKIFITGSNSKLLSSELATHLTGRYVKTELYPFSFVEYLHYQSVDYSFSDTKTKSLILKSFDDYLQNGGFPEYLKYADKNQLQNIYEDIIYKDLIVRFGIKNAKAFKQLSHYYFTNFTKEISYNSLKSILGISNTNTIKDYTSYLEQAYLLFECYKFDYSMKQQISYAKKVYVVDNGLRNSISFRFSTDMGQLLENIVFLHLKKQYGDVWFYKTENNYEVDFCVHSNGIELYQVSYHLENDKTRQREIRSLELAMQELKTDKAFIITYNQFETIQTQHGNIEVLPYWYYAILEEKQFLALH